MWITGIFKSKAPSQIGSYFMSLEASLETQ